MSTSPSSPTGLSVYLAMFALAFNHLIQPSDRLKGLTQPWPLLIAVSPVNHVVDTVACVFLTVRAILLHDHVQRRTSVVETLLAWKVPYGMSSLEKLCTDTALAGSTSSPVVDAKQEKRDHGVKNSTGTITQPPPASWTWGIKSQALRLTIFALTGMPQMIKLLAYRDRLFTQSIAACFTFNFCLTELCIYKVMQEHKHPQIQAQQFRPSYIGFRSLYASPSYILPHDPGHHVSEIMFILLLIVPSYGSLFKGVASLPINASSDSTFLQTKLASLVVMHNLGVLIPTMARVTRAKFRRDAELRAEFKYDSEQRRNHELRIHLGNGARIYGRGKITVWGVSGRPELVSPSSTSSSWWPSWRPSVSSSRSDGGPQIPTPWHHHRDILAFTSCSLVMVVISAMNGGVFSHTPTPPRQPSLWSMLGTTLSTIFFFALEFALILFSDRPSDRHVVDYALVVNVAILGAIICGCMYDGV